MRQFKNEELVWLNKEIPSIPVKTYFGNTFLNKLFKNTWLLIFSNPYDLIPKSAEERRVLGEFLASLKKLNCQLVGFSSRSFEEHLECTNWVNSYLSDDEIFPVFFQKVNPLNALDDLSVARSGEDPGSIYLVDGTGMVRIKFGNLSKNSSQLKGLLAKVGELVLNGQLANQYSYES